MRQDHLSKRDLIRNYYMSKVRH